MEVAEALEEFGFSASESCVYQTLLRLVEAPVYVIAEETTIPRTTVYKVLDALKQHGVIQSFHKNGVLYYSPESPNVLLRILERKKDLVMQIMPELRALIDSSDIKPSVKLYEGLEGVRTVKEDVLTVLTEKKEMLYAIANGDMYRILPKYFPEWTKRRVHAGIHARLILPYKAKIEKNVFSQKNNTLHLREVRFLPQGFEDHECSINIYDTKLALFSLRKNQEVSVILESPPITDMFRRFFLFNWQILGGQK